MTYTEKSAQLAIEASVAVQVLLGTDPDDCEFIPIKPKPADANMLAEIAARWPGRGLRSVGVVGLVGTSPRCILKEPLEPETVDRLAVAFLMYISVLFGQSFSEQRAAMEIAGTHTEPEYDWNAKRYRLVSRMN